MKRMSWEIKIALVVAIIFLCIQPACNAEDKPLQRLGRPLAGVIPCAPANMPHLVSVSSAPPIHDSFLQFDTAALVDAIQKSGLQVTPQQVQESLAISNKPEYQKLANDAYNLLVEKGIVPKGTQVNILFLKGLKTPGFAMALPKLNIIVIPLEAADLPGLDSLEGLSKEDRQDLTIALASKIPHEVIHIVNKQTKPNISQLEDEYLAYKATYETAVALKAGPKTIEAQKLVYEAFGVLVNKKDEVCKGLGISTDKFKDVSYNEIKLSGKTVEITLYYGNQKQVFTVDVANKNITWGAPRKP